MGTLLLRDKFFTHFSQLSLYLSHPLPVSNFSLYYICIAIALALAVALVAANVLKLLPKLLLLLKKQLAK